MIHNSLNTVYLLSPLAIGVICLALFTLVLLKGNRNFSTRLFLCMLFSLALVSLLLFGMRISPDVYQAAAWDKGVAIFAMAAFVFYYHFALVYTQTRAPRAILYIAYLVLIITIILTPTTDFFIKGVYVADYGYAPIMGPLLPIWSIIYVLLVGGGIFAIIRRYRFLPSYEEKNRLVYLSIAGFFPVIGGLLDAVSPLPPVGLWCNLAFAVLCTVAIYKYQLLDINIVVQKSLVYFLTSILAAVPFVGLMYFFSLVFPRYSNSWWSHTLIILVIAVILRPIYNWTQQLVDRLFYRGRYDYLKALIQFSRQTQSIIDLKQLSSSLVELLQGALRTSSVYLLLRSGDNRGLYVIASIGQVKPPSGTILTNDSRIVHWFKSRAEILFSEQFAVFPQLQSIPLAEKTILEQIGAQVLVPIHSLGKELCGILILGKKLSEQAYSNQDRQLLITLCTQMSVAFENARLYNESIQARENLEALLSNMTDCVVIVNTDYVIQFMNRVAIEKFGNKVGDKCWHFLGKDAVCTRCSLQYFLSGERGNLIYSESIRGREYDINAAPLINLDASLSVIEVLRDITERKQVEEERQRSAKLDSIGTLAGGIAHDFNNLLTGIMGNISLAKRYVEPKGKASERLEEAEKASIRARDLTHQLLTFSRGGAPVKKLISISALIKESAAFALHGSAVKPVFSIPEDLWTVEADEGQISQVIHNLVKNADEAMPEGGVVEINVKNITVQDKSILPLSKGRYVEIAITDSGIGIKKENLTKIFDPYFTTKQKGSGLGLATSYSIIKNHGGNITADSTLTVGTTLTIYLTAAEKQVSKKEEEEVQPALIGQGRILVMDDEEMIKEMLNNMLSLAGYQVELTSDGAEAIERYTKAKESGEPFDAVIFDLTIPGGMGGKEAIKKLREIYPEVKAIVSSGYATDPIMADYKKYGFSGVVTKPYSATKIEKILHSLLSKK